MTLLTVITQNLLNTLQPYYFAGGPPLILGVLFLAITRDFLFKERIHEYNSEASLQYQRPQPCSLYCDGCNPREMRFRTLDGHCNNLNRTAMGMKNLRYGHLALNDPAKPPRGIFEPDPYIVAEKLLKAKNGSRNVAPIYNLFMTSWINFNLHDWVHHDVVEEDPWTLQAGPEPSDTFVLKKTFFDKEGFSINTETPWWDASQVYGTSEEAAAKLRVSDKCEMKLDNSNNLPLGPDGIPLAGFTANWWAGVEVLQQLFVLEHNHVCGMLRKAHPSFSERDLYDLSRMIVAAEIARIHTVEWTPALLNNDVMNVSMHNNWDGLSAAFLQHEMEQLEHDANWVDKLKLVKHQTVLKALQQFLPATSGVGHKTELFDHPYSLSEDFVSAYRLHPLVPDEFKIGGEVVKARDMVGKNARVIVSKFGMEKIVDGFGHQPPTTLTLHNYPDFLTHVQMPDGLRNMAVTDIVRDRERGMPRYNQARRQYGIKPAETFEDITDNAEWVADLKSVYKSVEDVDFLVGCLAESPRPSGYVISNVQFYVFIVSASRRLLCDRFYQESYNAGTYTAEGIKHIESTTFKSLLLRHYPDLAGSIGGVTNAFLMWTGEQGYKAHQEL